MAKRPALGKGLSALINDRQASELTGKNGYIPNLPIDIVNPNPYQPRAEVGPEKLVELADSIREHGVIEPLLVTQVGENKYELIAGERRWRAAQLAGLKYVPVVVKETTPQDMLELAVIENIQREDLNAIEEAMAFEQLYSAFSLTHEQISKRLGISRPAVANKIRLLSLPDEIKKGLLEDKISEGHARSLLSLKSKDAMIAAYKLILKDHLSVRAVEELVRRLNKGQMKDKKRTNRILDGKTLEIEKDLKGKFGDHVVFFRSKRGGKITIPFKNEDELDGLMRKLL